MKAPIPEYKQRIKQLKAQQPNIVYLMLYVSRQQADREHLQGVKKLVQLLQHDVPYVNAKVVRIALKDTETSNNETLILPGRPDTTNVKTKLPPFRITKLPGKGFGLIATRDIKPGELVLQEKPILMMSYEDEDAGRHAELVEDMSNEQQQKFYALCDKDGSKGKTVEGIWATNVLQLGLSTEGGVFETCSRINHSCRPNMQNTWSPVNGQMTMHAVREVPAGSELTISYLDVLAATSERKLDSMERYGFICTCEVCTLPIHKLKASDKRRRQIANNQTVLQDGLFIKPFRNLELIEDSLELLELEGLPALRWEFADPACRITHDLGMLEDAREWARKAYEWGKISFGEQDRRVQDARRTWTTGEKPANWLEDKAIQALLGKIRG